MKKYTQKEFDKFEIIDGYKQCPTGDYTNINSFGDRCSFGESCRFGERCRFENTGRFIGKYPYFACIGLGSRIGSKTYIYNLEKGIYVRCGCFFGTEKEFVDRVKKEKGDELYLDIIEIAKKSFK